jgi:catechol 2,3-dioxygenase-like lactoylglutathione lyase family enzyme
MTAPVVEFKHINIPTRDLPRSFRFYTEVLGFKYVMNLGPEKIVLDAWGFDFFLEQVDELTLNPKFHMGLKADRAWLLSFAERLKEHGVPLVKGNNPGPIVYDHPNGVRTALYFQDPDGWEIEVYTAI